MRSSSALRGNSRYACPRPTPASSRARPAVCRSSRSPSRCPARGSARGAARPPPSSRPPSRRGRTRRVLEPAVVHRVQTARHVEHVPERDRVARVGLRRADARQPLEAQWRVERRGGPRRRASRSAWPRCSWPWTTCACGSRRRTPARSARAMIRPSCTIEQTIVTWYSESRSNAQSDAAWSAAASTFGGSGSSGTRSPSGQGIVAGSPAGGGSVCTGSSSMSSNVWSGAMTTQPMPSRNTARIVGTWPGAPTATARRA